MLGGNDIVQEPDLGQSMNNRHFGARAALRQFRLPFLAAFGFSMVINLLMLVSPLYMLQLYDRVLTSRSQETLLMLTIIAIGMIAILGLLDAVRSRVMVRVGNAFDASMGERIFTATYRQALDGKGGENAQGLRDVDQVRQFMTGQGLFAFFDSPWVPIYLVVIYLIHPLMGYVAIGGAVILFLFALLTEMVSRRPMSMAASYVIKANSFAESSLRNADTVRSMGMLARIRTLWRNLHHQALSRQSQAADRGSMVSAASKSLRIILQILMLATGGWLALQQEITPGMMIAGSIIMGRAVAPVEQAIGQWRGFLSARSAFTRLEDLTRAYPQAEKPMQLPRPDGNVDVESVTAMPPTLKAPVLRGLSFSISAGETIAVIGPSASGKSTLARLLVGVWPAFAGHVRLGGAEIYQWDDDDLGEHVGYLPQDIELFDGTVKDNIARFGDVDPEKIVKAAEMAGVHEMILRLPDGYDTEIGEAGNRLSGGQRQRIGLARALYGDPVLVVLDEPNSNLDNAGDLALLKALGELKRQGTTTVLITHRPSMLQNVDKILVLQDGMVAMYGPREEIINQVMRPLPSQTINKITSDNNDVREDDQGSSMEGQSSYG